MKTSYTLIFLCSLLLRGASGSLTPPNCRLQKGLSSQKQDDSGNYVTCESSEGNQDISSSSSTEKKDGSEEVDEDVTWLVASRPRDLHLYGTRPELDQMVDWPGVQDPAEDNIFERVTRPNGHQFLRFGRNVNHNFMRFGRGDLTPFPSSSSSSSTLPVFLRLARAGSLGHQFMRIGRGFSQLHPYYPAGLGVDSDDTLGADLMDQQQPNTAMSTEVEDDDHFDRLLRSMSHNFLRFGRPHVTDRKLLRDVRTAPTHNFMRFGRMPEHKFLRFGRSSDTSSTITPRNLASHFQDSSLSRSLDNNKVLNDVAEFKDDAKKNNGHVFFRFGRK